MADMYHNPGFILISTVVGVFFGFFVLSPICVLCPTYTNLGVRIRVIVVNATFNNISAISWWSFFFVFFFIGGGNRRKPLICTDRH